jgi:hypothetical protein
MLLGLRKVLGSVAQEMCADIGRANLLRCVLGSVAQEMCAGISGARDVCGDQWRKRCVWGLVALKRCVLGTF